MVQIVATLISLLVGISALAVIAVSLAEEWDAVKRALLRVTPSTTPPLPPRARMVTRRTRIVRVIPDSSLRAAA